MKNFPIEYARQEDVAEIIHLLAAVGLPTSDLPSDNVNFLLIKDRHQVLAAIGVEVYVKEAFLRSFVTHPEFRRLGLGQKLLEASLSLAQAKGVEEIFLFTDSAPSYFKQRGFEDVSRSHLPETIRNTSQFTSICPASAQAMRKRI